STILRELFLFLSVDPAQPIDLARRHNVTLTPRWPAVHAAIGPLVRAGRRVLPESISAAAGRWYLAPRSEKPTPDERARMVDVYRDDIRELERLIDRDLAAWRR